MAVHAGGVDGQPDRFIDAVFTHGPELSVTSELKRQDYAERVARGGYPEAIKRNESARRRRFFTDYLNDLIDREVRELSDIEYAARVRQLMRMLATRTASPLILSPLASDLGVTQPTVRHYVDLLEQVYLIHRIPAWSRNLTARATATPKVVVADSGLASHLVGQGPERLAEPDGAMGPLIEAFVAMELIKQLAWSNEMVDVYHFRTRDQVKWRPGAYRAWKAGVVTVLCPGSMTYTVGVIGGRGSWRRRITSCARRVSAT